MTAECMYYCQTHFKEEEHGYELKCWADLANGLDLVPFIGHKVGPPDADRSRVTF